MPGLIEGAHQNKGLGHKFLKHVERTKILLYLLDGSLDPNDKRSPLKDLISLQRELELYDKSFIQKPSLIVLNKSDTENTEYYQTNLQLLKSNFPDKDIISISGQMSLGLEKLTQEIKKIADIVKKEQINKERFPFNTNNLI